MLVVKVNVTYFTLVNGIIEINVIVLVIVLVIKANIVFVK